MITAVHAGNDPGIDLLQQNTELRAQLEAADEILGAIRSGSVDAIAVDTPAGKRVFTLKGAEEPYRVMVETMSEGAVTVTPAGHILFCNRRFADMVKAGQQTIVGSSLPAHFTPDDAAKIASPIRESGAATTRVQATLLASDATPVPVSVAMHAQSDGETRSVAIVVTDLTEVTAAQRHRRISEERYHTLVDTINDGLLQIDEKLQITFVNLRFAQMLGYGEAELLGRRGTDFLDEATRQSIPARVERRKAGIAERYEMAWLARDGRSVPTLVSARPLLGQDGHYRGSVSVIADLTETRRLERTRDDLARLVESAEDAVTGKDLQGLITFWNKGAEHLYGYTAAQAIGKPVTILAPVERQDEVAALIARIAHGESVEHHHETERVTSLGKRLWVSLRMSPIRDDGGKITGISTIARDIALRREAEAKVQAAAQYDRSLIEASLDPLVTISPEGKITDVNEATAAATGVSRDQLIGSDFSDYFTDPEKAEAGYREAYAKGFVSDYPLSIRHVSGRIIDVLYNASVYRRENGEVAGLFAAARDVTAQRQAEAGLRSSQQRLALALQAGRAGTFDWDITNNINRWSPEVEDLYGVPRGTFGGTFEAWGELVFPDDLVAAIETSLKTGSFAGEWRVRRPTAMRSGWQRVRPSCSTPTVGLTA